MIKILHKFIHWYIVIVLNFILIFFHSINTFPKLPLHDRLFLQLIELSKQLCDFHAVYWVADDSVEGVVAVEVVDRY